MSKKVKEQKRKFSFNRRTNRDKDESSVPMSAKQPTSRREREEKEKKKSFFCDEKREGGHTK
jgi:hypothetical protein